MKQELNNKFLIFNFQFLIIFLGIFFANAVKAVCPICIVAVGAGLGLSRWLGVDDVISGLWIGALLVSVSVWTHSWVVKRGWGFKYSLWVISLAYYLFAFIPLYFSEILGHPLNKIFGIDKLVFGAGLGTIIFIASVWIHNFLKKKNNDKSYFPYQKVVVPVLCLLLTSLILWMTI
jgi:hypothetical protein